MIALITKTFTITTSRWMASPPSSARLETELIKQEIHALSAREFETIIQQIVRESVQETKESGKNRLLRDWRVKLETEPPCVPLHKVDEIVREVRRRLLAIGRP